MKREITLRIISADLPASVKGMSVAEGNSIIIAINDNLQQQEQAAAFLHECLHIWHDDHNSTRNIHEIESERHAELRRLLSF